MVPLLKWPALLVLFLLFIIKFIDLIAYTKNVSQVRSLADRTFVQNSMITAKGIIYTHYISENVCQQNYKNA